MFSFSYTKKTKTVKKNVPAQDTNNRSFRPPPSVREFLTKWYAAFGLNPGPRAMVEPMLNQGVTFQDLLSYRILIVTPFVPYEGCKQLEGVRIHGRLRRYESTIREWVAATATPTTTTEQAKRHMRLLTSTRKNLAELRQYFAAADNATARDICYHVWSLLETLQDPIQDTIDENNAARSRTDQSKE